MKLLITIALFVLVAACGSDPAANNNTINNPFTDMRIPDAGTEDMDPDMDTPECTENEDCPDGICVNMVCRPESCFDGVQNADESDVDCGGSCEPCANGRACFFDTDCTSVWCNEGTCAEPSCDDGIRNGTETDVDCGGDCEAGCADGRTCRIADDCQSGVCEGEVCQAPRCGDGVVQGDEVCDDGGLEITCRDDCRSKRCVIGEDYDSLQEALDAPECFGAYLPDGVYMANLQINRDFLIVGESRNGAILDGNEVGSVIITTSDVFLELESLTIRNGRSTFGGGLNTFESDVKLTDVAIRENRAENSGGGIFARQGSIEINNSVITENLVQPVTADLGEYLGGGIDANNTVVFLEDSEVSRNEIEVLTTFNAIVRGAGISVNGGGVSLQRSHVIENEVRQLNSSGGTDVRSGGGGIYCYSGAEVIFDDSSLSRNVATGNAPSGSTFTAQGGGAFLSDGCDVEFINNSLVEDNEARADSATSVAYGGAIFLNQDAELLFRDSTARNNIARARNTGGGGFLNSPSGDASTVILRSTIAGNRAQADGPQAESAIAFGGAFMLWSAGSDLTIRQSTISANIAQANFAAVGGALFSGPATTPASCHTIIENSTVANNRVITSNIAVASAMEVVGNPSICEVEFHNVTIAGNTAEGSATQPSAINTGIPFFSRNSIFANNGGPNCSVGMNGSVISAGYNLLDDTSGCPLSTVDDLLGDPLLAALQDNGGPTHTMAVQAGSPAIDAGDPAGCRASNEAILTVDQRNLPRNDARCDIGAFEAQ